MLLSWTVRFVWHDAPVVQMLSNAIFFQTHWVGEYRDRPLNLYYGLRYEETDVHSEALVPLYDRVEWSIVDNSKDVVVVVAAAVDPGKFHADAPV